MSNWVCAVIWCAAWTAASKIKRNIIFISWSYFVCRIVLVYCIEICKHYINITLDYWFWNHLSLFKSSKCMWKFITWLFEHAFKRTAVRTALSRPCPAGQTDNGQLFPKIWKNPDVCVWLYFKLWNHCVYNHSFFRTLKWNRCKLTLWIYNPMERRSRSEYLESRWHSEDLENSGFKRLKKSGFEST